jgi:hypothetical protein
MTVRNLTSKIISTSLILSFFSVGVVPAKSDCAGSCTCNTETENQFQGSFSLSGESHAVHMHAAISGPSHQTSSDESSLSIYFPDHTCHKAGIVSETCDMEPVRPLEALQSASPLMPWSERSMLKAITSVLTEKSSIESPFYRLTFSYLMNVKTTSNPLYLQNLSLLC